MLNKVSEISRRGLFRPLAKKSSNIYPPYAKDVADFTTCTKCEEKSCVSECEEGIIVVDESGVVRLDFSKSGCTFCQKCALVCTNEVLSVLNEPKIFGSIEIGCAKCLAWNSTMCFTCKDACQTKAIEFFGLYRPVVDMQKCTMCGFCVSVCPTDAFNLKGVLL